MLVYVGSDKNVQKKQSRAQGSREIAEIEAWDTKNTRLSSGFSYLLVAEYYETGTNTIFKWELFYQSVKAIQAPPPREYRSMVSNGIATAQRTQKFPDFRKGAQLICGLW